MFRWFRLLTVLSGLMLAPLLSTGGFAQTTPPLLFSPPDNSAQNFVAVSYLLLQTPASSSVTLTFNDGTNSYVAFMGNTTSVGFGWDPRTNILTASASVTSVSGNFIRSGVSGALPDGTYTVTISYQNQALNSPASASTTNVVVDATGPVISLLGSDPVDVNQDEAYSDAGATATDARDGSVTADIITTNPVDTSVPGTYTVRYNVDDALFNHAAEVTRTVNVIASTPTPTPTATAAPTLGPVTGNISPAAGNVVVYVYGYDRDLAQTGTAEGSAITASDGSFSMAVATPGNYLVKPLHNEYSFTPTEDIAASGRTGPSITGAFSALTKPSKCAKKDNAKRIQSANTKARALYLYLRTKLGAAEVLAQQMSAGSKRTSLLASLSAIRSAGASGFTALINNMEGMPASVLNCQSGSGCQRVGLGSILRTYNRKVTLLSDKLAKLAQALRKAKVGTTLANQIDAKRGQLLGKSQEAAAKLPTQTYSCSG